MLRCRGVGLLSRSARLQGHRALHRFYHQLSDRTKRPAALGSDHVGIQAQQSRRLSASTYRLRQDEEDSPTKDKDRRLQEEDEKTRQILEETPDQTLERPITATATQEFTPMSDYEYEKSLWEATQGVPAPGEPVPAPSKEVRKQHPKQHRPRDVVSSPQTAPSDPKKPKSKKKKDSSSTAKRRNSRLQKGEPVSLHEVNPNSIKFVPIDEGVDLQVPRLAHHLEKVLFNPGVYHLQDPRSKVFNFDPYLTSIMPVDEFDFDALREYVASSKDEKLHNMSKKHGAKYCGSTSSMTSILSHFHYLISHWRKPAFPSISESFVRDSDNFTQLTRAPASTFVHHKDGVYAMDADKEYDFGRENVLMMLGHSLEKLLTLPPGEFEKYRRDRSHLISQETKDAGADAFHYGTIGKFMMRSQLDAQDPRLPGTGVFDIKTRAVFPIRIDLKSYKDHVGYEIWNRFGQFESFEREYYDLIRAAFLRYSLQVRIGRMDGCFVAYHNTKRIFGFQYVSLSEMDEALHGTAKPRIGDQEFKLSVEMLETLLDKATAKYPGRKLQITVEARDTDPPVLFFFARPVSDEEIRASDEKAISIIDEAQQDIENARAKAKDEEEAPDAVEEESPETELDEEAAAEDSPVLVDADLVWEEMIAKVEEVIEDEAMGMESVRDAVQDALHENELLSHDNGDEQHPSLETLVEALVAEMPSSRDARDSTGDVDNGNDVDPATDGRHTTEAQSENQSSESMTSTVARTKELKELILKFSKAVDFNAKQARGFERALGDLLARAKAQTDVTGEEAANEESASEEASGLQGPATEETVSESQEQSSTAEAEKDASQSADDNTTAATEGEETTGEQPSGKTDPVFTMPDELFSAVVSVSNFQNGEAVDRPVETHHKLLRWTAHYAIHEMDRKQATSVYPAVKKRRFDVFGDSSKKRPLRDKERQRLLNMSRQGSARRRKESAQGRKIHVAWSEASLPAQGSK